MPAPSSIPCPAADPLSSSRSRERRPAGGPPRRLLEAHRRRLPPGGHAKRVPEDPILHAADVESSPGDLGTRVRRKGTGDRVRGGSGKLPEGSLVSRAGALARRYVVPPGLDRRLRLRLRPLLPRPRPMDLYRPHRTPSAPTPGRSGCLMCLPVPPFIRFVHPAPAVSSSRDPDTGGPAGTSPRCKMTNDRVMPRGAGAPEDEGETVRDDRDGRPAGAALPVTGLRGGGRRGSQGVSP